MVQMPAYACNGVSTPMRWNSARRCMASKGQLCATSTRPLEEVDEVGGNVVERWGSTNVGGADAVDGLWPQVALRVDQGRPLAGGGAVRVEVDDGDLGDAVAVAGEQAGGLGVDHGVPEGRGHSGSRVALAVVTAVSQVGGSASGSPCLSRT